LSGTGSADGQLRLCQNKFMIAYIKNSVYFHILKTKLCHLKFPSIHNCATCCTITHTFSHKTENIVLFCVPHLTQVCQVTVIKQIYRVLYTVDLRVLSLIAPAVLPYMIVFIDFLVFLALFHTNCLRTLLIISCNHFWHTPCSIPGQVTNDHNLNNSSLLRWTFLGQQFNKARRKSWQRQ
jgi:hypothetical protein